MALRQLGIARTVYVPPVVRQALEAWHFAEVGRRSRVCGFEVGVVMWLALIWAGPAAGFLRRLPTLLADNAKGPVQPIVQQIDGSSVWTLGIYSALLPVVALLWVSFHGLVVALMLSPFLLVYLTLRGRFPAYLVDRARYRLVHSLSDAIRACAKCQEEQGAARYEAQEELFNKLSALEPTLLRSQYIRSAVVRPGHRRRALERHTRLVVARLRRTQNDIDHELDGALTELAGLLLMVQERYATGRVGALLDRKDTTGMAAELAAFEPTQSRGAGVLRLIVASGLTVAGVVGIAHLGLPDMAQGQW